MRLQRSSLGVGGKPTMGRLTSNDNQFSCVTLERSTDGEHPCIPSGVYRVTIDWHHPLDLEHRYRCPELLNVPGRSQIQMHIANQASELLGCIAVGETVRGDEIESSGSAFRRLMAYLQGAELPFELEVLDP